MSVERKDGEGNGNPLQYSCLKNPKDREARWARVHTRGTNKTSRQEVCTTYVGHRRPSVLPKERSIVMINKLQSMG